MKNDKQRHRRGDFALEGEPYTGKKGDSRYVRRELDLEEFPFYRRDKPICNSNRSARFVVVQCTAYFSVSSVRGVVVFFVLFKTIFFPLCPRSPCSQFRGSSAGKFTGESFSPPLNFANQKKL
ncbi:unnamed protein product [Ascophyllum nodosum]